MNQAKQFLAILFISAALAACGGGGGGSGDDATGGGSPSPGETAAMADAASDVEDAFLSGDPEQVLGVLSAEASAFYHDDIDAIEPQMVDFGNDFKSRELIYATENYAEYAFTSGNETFTVAFSLQEDGSWKLMRF